MKRSFALMIAALVLLTALPALAVDFHAAARTEKLDMTGVTEPMSNASEGWAYDPTGREGQPLLTLTNYGSESEHSAPILVPANTTIVVNGDNYIDNACMGADCDVLSGSYDGFLRIEGTGSLNLYALSYYGRGISVPTGGANDNTEFLYIDGTTINVYSQERTNNTASKIKEGIYANHGAEIRNAVINIHDGVKAIALQGITPIGGVNEDNCDELLIDNSVINISMPSANNLWNYATGIYYTFGRIRMRNSHVTINAGSNSIYSYLSTVIESGTLDVVSTPASTAAALIYVGCLKVMSGAERVYLTTTKFPATTVLKCRTSGASELGDGLEMAIGTFADGNFATAPDSDNNNLPALKIVPGEVTPNTHTVNFYGYDGTLIEAVEVEDGQAAVAPEMDETIVVDGMTYRFAGWDVDFSEVTDDMEVHARYLLLGDVNFDGKVDATDALLVMRYSMLVITLTEDQQLVADYNLSDGPNATDALLIMRVALNLA